MKVLAVTFLIVAGAVAALVYFGGFLNFDPAANAAEFKQTVKPGMTWEEVADLQSPRKLVIYDIDSRGFPVERERKFDPEQLKQQLADGKIDQGFGFQYVFTADDAVVVSFDGSGKVTGMDKLMTTHDLLQGNLISQ